MNRSLLSTAGVSRLSALHPWRTLLLWVVLLVGAAMSASSLNDALTTEGAFLANPESQKGADLIEERLRNGDTVSETIVVRSETSTVDDAEFEAVVSGIVAELTGQPDMIESVATWYDTSNAALVSADRHATVLLVTMQGDLSEAEERVADYRAALQHASASADGFEVLAVGDVTLADEFNTIAEEDLARGEMIGLAVAIVILIAVLGTLVAAGLPIIVGFLSIFVALGLASIVGRMMDLSFFIVNMIFMIGLAVGVDYALFIISRYREERQRGHAKIHAIEIAGATASKAVLFSGATVVLALMGMLLVPETTFRSLGIGATTVVIVAVFASVTLLPAMLSLLGDKIEFPRRRKVDAKPVNHAEAKGVWGRLSNTVMSHPLASLVLATTLLVALALPYFDMNKGSAGVSSLPEGTDTRAAFDILSSDFSAGMISPVEVVVDGDLSDPAIAQGIEDLQKAIAATGQFGGVMVESNEAGDHSLLSFPTNVAPDGQEAYADIDLLRNELIPQAFGSRANDVYVTGTTAFNVDFKEITDTYMPLVFAFVLGLSFVVLTVAFRSLIVPIKAIIMNLLSVGAAYGAIVLVFQKGYGADLLGFQQTPTIETWLPLFLFSVLFGLSMDYHVFLLSRIREHYDVTKNNTESVAYGLQSTARLITGAALIMVAVFSGFATGRLVMMQQVGFGLAVAVFLDATVVRSVLVPASMALLGDRNWYLPKALHWLPNLQIEGKVRMPELPVPVFQATSTSGDD
ncbi:MAG: MMPL family transporter [Thermomicrobiales bacterium]|nr:MMPL family transporter [Thermomicrobiales bacterium]